MEKFFCSCSQIVSHAVNVGLVCIETSVMRRQTTQGIVMKEIDETILRALREQI